MMQTKNITYHWKSTKPVSLTLWASIPVTKHCWIGPINHLHKSLAIPWPLQVKDLEATPIFPITHEDLLTDHQNH